MEYRFEQLYFICTCFRGRNAENHHLPKNADPADYMYSTAFEGLIGYLYLTKQDERLKEIFKMCKE